MSSKIKALPRLRKALSLSWSSWLYRLWVVIAMILTLGCLELSNRLYVRVDLSPFQRYTLAPEVLELLSKLDEDLVIEAFLPLSAPPPYREVAHHTHDLLQELAAIRSQISLKVIDTAQERSTEERKELIAHAQRAHVPLNRLSAEREGKQIFLEIPYGVSLASLNQREVTPPVEQMNEVEYQLASALERLVERRPKARIGIAQGFGEPDIINSPLARHLGSAGELIPVRLDGDPLEDEVGVLLILGATRSYGERARWIIDRFRCDGGGVVVALDHRAQSELFTQVWSHRVTGLEPLWRRYGIEVDHRWVIADTQHPSPAPLRRDARGHIVATPHPLYPQGIAQDHPISAPFSSIPIPMAPLFKLPKQAQLLVSSYSEATALKNLKSLDLSEAEQVLNAPEGFPLAFALEETVSDCLSMPQEVQIPTSTLVQPLTPSSQKSQKSQNLNPSALSPSRLVMIGSGRRLLSADYQGVELLLNAIAWTRGEERLLALKRKRPEPPQLNLTVDQQNLLKWVTPLAPSLLIGILTIWLRRPRRYRSVHQHSSTI